MKYTKVHEKRMLKCFLQVRELLQVNNIKFTINEMTSKEGEFPRLSLTAQTKIGRMKLSLFDIWIHLRFSNVKKANEIFQFSNPYSGKHNFFSKAKPLNVFKDIIEWFEVQVKSL